jgi:dTDP-4-dehydrorhamnose 3,5-epimerase
MIQGVKTKALRVVPDERGRLMEILRVDDVLFEKFGQVYLSTTYPGIIKAWHFHKKQDDNITVVRGMLKLVLYDAREDSPTRGEVNEFFIGPHNPMLVHVPKNVYHGWKCTGLEEALVINCVTEAYDYHDPDEQRLPFDSKEVPYDWAVKMG